MAYEFYVSIKGTKQGKFKGESPRDRWKDKITAFHFDYGVSSSNTSSFDTSRGKRVHSPVKITKPWGAATPQIFQALTTNETLESVVFEFTRSTAEGIEEVFYTIHLTDANVVGIHQTAEQSSSEHGASGALSEEISFSFKTITVEEKHGETKVTDSWQK